MTTPAWKIGTPIDGGDLHAKKLVRGWSLEQAGMDKARVLELFGGNGIMHAACYKKVAKHLAFDLKGVEKGTWLQGDNRILLKENVNGWTLYDADAYVSPWIVLSDVCRMREPGHFMLVATCNSRRYMAGGGMNQFFRWVSGYGNLSKCAPLMCSFYPDIIRSIFRLWAGYGVTVKQVKMIRANHTPHGYYFGIECIKSKGVKSASHLQQG